MTCGSSVQCTPCQMGHPELYNVNTCRHTDERCIGLQADKADSYAGLYRAACKRAHLQMLLLCARIFPGSYSLSVTPFMCLLSCIIQKTFLLWLLLQLVLHLYQVALQMG
jgi:hypothetical protein